MYRFLHKQKKLGIEWKPGDKAEEMPDMLKEYYSKHPESLEEFFRAREAADEQYKNWSRYKNKYALADAWSTANSSPMRGGRGLQAFPPNPDSPPEEWDFKNLREEKITFRSPDAASELINKISHTLGATLVGICRVNPDWVYQGILRGKGKVDFSVPEHWKYAIVVASPHEWDSLYANPTYGTSYDAYSRERQIAGKLEVFIRELGYPARSHVPPTSYDLIMPPLAIDAGLGELGRNGVLITPELGANTRLAAVTTNLPMQPDKPIDIGIQDFCKKCKICAEQCPSGAIGYDDEPGIVRGYKRWHIDQDKCFRIWCSVATSHPRGCRVCLAVCPYSRKNNWIHSFAREADARDPTGIVNSSLLAMQKGLFEYPDAADYLPPPNGNNSIYLEPPDWLKTENWCDIDTDH